jgi:iron complex outermembrane receptor protein
MRTNVLHAAIVLALSQGAFAQTASAPVEPEKEREKLAQASDVQVAQAAPAPAPAKPATAAKTDAAVSSEQIVVTARRREELIQDVPGAVSAFTGAQIEQAGIQDVTGLADLVPNTTLKTSRATNTTLTAFIRGIGQQDPVAGFEQGVGIYLDDVYLPRPQGALQDIYDIERIEILRGPQGTLYGRNTIGGAVKYVSRKLSAMPEFNIKATLGSFGETDFVGRASVPLTDTFRIGGTIASFNHDGYGHNVVNGMDNYNKDVVAGRISAEFVPNASLFVRFAADYTEDKSNPKQGYRLTPGPAPTNEPVLQGVFDTRANLYSVLGNPQKVTTEGQSLLIDYALNSMWSVKSITSHRKGKSTAPIDFDSLNSVLWEAPALYHDDSKSEELQLLFNTQKWQGVAGVYYMKANAFNEFDALLNAVIPAGVAQYVRDDIDTKTWAAFADLNYSVSPTFDVSVGARYTSDQRRAAISQALYAGLTGSPALGNPNAVLLAPLTNMSKDQLDRTDTKFTPKFNASWRFQPGQNLYFTYAEGFKGGMFDPRMNLGGNPNSPTSLLKREGVKPEEVATSEFGIKSSNLGGRLQINADVFYTDYKNVQIPGALPTYDAAGNVNGFSGNVTNAGKAKIHGLELEGLWRVNDAFSIAGMYGYIDAKYKEWIVANGLTGSAAALVNIASSAEFQNTPKTQWSITPTYEWPMTMFNRGGALALQGTAAHKGKTYQTEIVRTTGIPGTDVFVPGNNMLTQNGYTLYDASLLWTSRDRKLTLGVVGRNLTDKHYKVAGYNYVTFFNTITTFYGDPRTVKFVASMTF